MEFFNNSRSIEVLESTEQAYMVASAFAGFSRALSDFDALKLKLVIPDFHNPSIRFRRFLDGLQHASSTRLEACSDEAEFAKNGEPWISEWQCLMDIMPVRVCHNDCKINNILMSSEGDETRAVIDLDTSMPGCLMTDFGDLVRTCCNPVAEDSTDLENVKVRPEVFAALAKGYLEGMVGVISPQEVASLMQGALMQCFIQGVRFLTDFLDGDAYYRVAYPLHNLDRARNQFQLFRSLQREESILRPMLLK